jgi:hypothetical protein
LFIRHTLDIAELHTRLIEADRAGGVELLELSAEPACWRSYSGIGGQRQATLKPDSYLRLGAGEFEDSYFIEVDRGTEGSRALLAKLRDYLAYQASGLEQAGHGVFPRVLWTVPDEARGEAIAGCIERLPNADGGLFAVACFNDALAVLDPAAGEGNRHFGRDNGCILISSN